MNQGNDSINHLPDMPNITFSTNGIQHRLSVLDMNKASGPDNISPFILKHCANEISPFRYYNRQLIIHLLFLIVYIGQILTN